MTAFACAAGMLVVSARAVGEPCSKFAQQSYRSGEVARCSRRAGKCVPEAPRPHSTAPCRRLQARSPILAARLGYPRAERIERILSHRLDQRSELSLARIEPPHRREMLREAAPVRCAVRNEWTEARHYTPQRHDEQERKHNEYRQRVFGEPAG